MERLFRMPMQSSAGVLCAQSRPPGPSDSWAAIDAAAEPMELFGGIKEDVAVYWDGNRSAIPPASKPAARPAKNIFFHLALSNLATVATFAKNFPCSLKIGRAMKGSVTSGCPKVFEEISIF